MGTLQIKLLHENQRPLGVDQREENLMVQRKLCIGWETSTRPLSKENERSGLIYSREKPETGKIQRFSRNETDIAKVTGYQKRVNEVANILPIRALNFSLTWHLPPITLPKLFL